MAWRLAKSLEKLREQINKEAPKRSKASDGAIGDAAHAASNSDHNPNAKGVVCAIDITHDPKGGLDAHKLAEHLRTHRHPNLRYVISNARIAGAWTNWQWQPSSGHYQHAHISVGNLSGTDGKSTGRYDSIVKWDIGTNEEDEMYKGKSAKYWYEKWSAAEKLYGKARGERNSFLGKLLKVKDVFKKGK